MESNEIDNIPKVSGTVDTQAIQADDSRDFQQNMGDPSSPSSAIELLEGVQQPTMPLAVVKDNTFDPKIFESRRHHLRERVAACIRLSRRRYYTNREGRLLETLQSNRAELLKMAAKDAAIIDALPCLPIPITVDTGNVVWPKSHVPISLHASGPKVDERSPEGGPSGFNGNGKSSPQRSTLRYAAPEPLIPAQNLVTNTMNGRIVRLQSWELPFRPTLPPYKSWVRVRGNVLALDVGQTLFYVDEETGESLPFNEDSDADGTNDLVRSKPQIERFYIYSVVV